jgi:hypothetical protein
MSMSNRRLEQLEALDQFAPEARPAEVRMPANVNDRAARTNGVAAFFGWVLAMCVHPFAAWRRLTKVGRAVVLAVYGLFGYTMGTLLLMTFN